MKVPRLSPEVLMSQFFQDMEVCVMQVLLRCWENQRMLSSVSIFSFISYNSRSSVYLCAYILSSVMAVCGWIDSCYHPFTFATEVTFLYEIFMPMNKWLNFGGDLKLINQMADIVTLVRHALVEICTVPVLLVDIVAICNLQCFEPSVCWRCWLSGRNGIWPVKNWVIGCWRGYLPRVRHRFAYGPADPLALTVSWFSKIRLVLLFWNWLTQVVRKLLLWSPYVIGQTIIFSCCGLFFFLSSFFHRLISAVGDWMFTILWHMVWP